MSSNNMISKFSMRILFRSAAAFKGSLHRHHHRKTAIPFFFSSYSNNNHRHEQCRWSSNADFSTSSAQSRIDQDFDDVVENLNTTNTTTTYGTTCKVTTRETLLDAFQVLNLERKFDLSNDELKQSYKKLMTNFHPDKHHFKSPGEQETLQQQASEVIQSYQILKDKPTRAIHLLQLNGKVDENMEELSLQELLNKNSHVKTNQMLLMEVMEIREAIDDAESNEEELNSLLEENNQRLNDTCSELTKAFEIQDLDRALELTVNLQYYSRIDETIREKKDIRN